MSFAYRFFICLFSYEIRILRAKISYFNYFFQNINLLKYLFYLFDKNINPIKSNEFSKFIKSNKKKWKKFEQEIKFDNTKETILVEDFVSHPRYSMGNILIGKYLQLFYKAQFMGLLRKGDIRGEVLFRSFGMDKFFYYKFLFK